VLCSLLIRYETADLYERTIAPNEPGFTLILWGLSLAKGAVQKAKEKTEVLD